MNEGSRLSIQSQNWIADNLYFFGAVSPSVNNEISIFYNLNLGYQSNLNFNRIKNLFFDFGYFQIDSLPTLIKIVSGLLVRRPGRVPP